MLCSDCEVSLMFVCFLKVLHFPLVPQNMGIWELFKLIGQDVNECVNVCDLSLPDWDQVLSDNK